MDTKHTRIESGARRVDGLFARALGLSQPDQQWLLERECGGDPRARGELERLLEFARELPEDGEPPAGDSWEARGPRLPQA